MKRFIYADNAATTSMSDNVITAIQSYFKDKYGNASSLYNLARIKKGNRKRMKEGRKCVMMHKYSLVY